MFTNFENMPAQPEKDIRFFYLSKNITLRNRKKLKHFLNDLLRMERMKLGHINFIFCSDQYLRNINRKYLQHDYYTDIITFDLSETKKVVEAEIYISSDRVCYNSSRIGTTFKEEIHRVIFHGLLHLCGYGDKSQKQREVMTYKEDYYLKIYRGN